MTESYVLILTARIADKFTVTSIGGFATRHLARDAGVDWIQSLRNIANTSYPISPTFVVVQAS